ncbi:MAG: ATP-binding cassette domain-containing protein [Deltaproteobacteria bacterium]|nr:ATP-binding cassette domain-containing protein [Deltaproteobacteria bacterium]
MSDTVIKVDHLSKQYRIGAREGYRTFRETLVDAAKAPFQRLGTAWSMAHRALSKRKDSLSSNPGSPPSLPCDDLIWALRDVSFEVKRGEVVGIIGRNGAGKTTLLKILSKITEPTEGRIELKGMIGSLLEVGTGFHPELTGHENVYLYGAILGMDRWEISRKFDEIVAFAELEKFIDTPVKKYSSGMYMRLAFAVAAHLEPNILLVDEVLAVGDASFWSKSIKRMRELNEQGMTILLVSHNMWLIQTFCSTSIFLEKGQIHAYDAPLRVIEAYRELNKSIETGPEITQRSPQSSEGVKLILFQIFPEGEWATEKEAFPHSGVKAVLGASVGNFKKIKFLVRITSPDGFSFFTSYSDMIDVPTGGQIKCEAFIPHLMLLPGEYLLWAAVCSEEGEEHILTSENIPFFVKSSGKPSDRYSLFWNEVNWRILC